MSKNEKKYPKGYWMGVGLSIGVAIGVALGPLFDNIGIGIAIGIAIGSGIGVSLERRNKDNLRALTEAEQKWQRWGTVVGLIVMLLAIAGVLAMILFLRAK